MDTKQAAALKALEFLEGRHRVGLGAGSTIAFLVEAVATLPNARSIEWFSSSFGTQQSLIRQGLAVQSFAGIDAIDIYFDGCDQLDYQLNALKSGGGIHTREKLLASMATEFILLGDISKRVATFSPRFPLVVEVLPDALGYTSKALALLPGFHKLALRHSTTTEGPAISSHGNYLVDTWFNEWPALEQLDQQVKAITGVVEHSLFYRLANRALLGNDQGVEVF